MNSAETLSKHLSIWAFVFVSLLVGCSQSTEEAKLPNSNVETANDLSELQQTQRNTAAAAKDKLFKSLLGQLTTSIGEKGIAKSIEVCKTEAPQLASSIGEEMNLKIGRTSLLLRNDKNSPPDWAASFVEDRTETEVNVDIGNDSLGVLFPIRLKEACIKCHGQADKIGPEVAKALSAHYPNDKATGFREGDLRGYFWVEVPKPQN